MATLTIIEDVRSIMDPSMDLNDPDVQKYINTANVFLSNVFADDTTVGDDLLEEIEKWYTAHLIALTRFRVASKEEVGDAAITYMGTSGKGLEATPYGQMVIGLDPSGRIQDSVKRKASIYAVKSFDDEY